LLKVNLIKNDLQVKPMSPSIPQSPTLEGLPKQFVAALRTLFDILDDKGSGFVKFTGK
jgi:hypothetical protein